MNEENYTQVPNNIPVRLIRTYCSKGGNIYFPGIYEPSTLPEKAYNNYYVIPAGPAIEKEELIHPVQDATIKNGSFEVEALTRIQPTPSLAEEINIKPAPTVKNIKAKIAKAVEAPPIKINEIDEKDLVSLPSIGKGTASKIKELREASPFIDYTDLNARVPLPFAKDWTAFNISF
jgi:hypothetical protein